jgi:hypothetical protein
MLLPLLALRLGMDRQLLAVLLWPCLQYPVSKRAGTFFLMGAALR